MKPRKRIVYTALASLLTITGLTVLLTITGLAGAVPARAETATQSRTCWTCVAVIDNEPYASVRVYNTYTGEERGLGSFHLTDRGAYETRFSSMRKVSITTDYGPIVFDFPAELILFGIHIQRGEWTYNYYTGWRQDLDCSVLNAVNY